VVLFDEWFVCRRIQLYFKEMQVNAKNWEKVAETTKLLYPAGQEYDVIERVGQTTEDALKSYEGKTFLDFVCIVKCL
jgi:hypothetical protein